MTNKFILHQRQLLPSATKLATEQRNMANVYYLSILLLFCCGIPKKSVSAAPIDTSSSWTGSAQLLENQTESLSQLMWSLHHGVTATYYYAVSQSISMIVLP